MIFLKVKYGYNLFLCLLNKKTKRHVYHVKGLLFAISINCQSDDRNHDEVLIVGNLEALKKMWINYDTIAL